MGNNSENSQSNRMFSFLNLEEKDYNIFLIIGILISFITMVVLVIVFKWNQPISTDENYVINHELLGTYGDFIGGVIGTLFAILAALLMFSTLKSQRELTIGSNKVQKEISEAAIKSQERLAKMQSKEAELQRFNSLFFELLSLFRSQREELNSSISTDGNPNNYFDAKMKELYASFEPSTSYKMSAKQATRDFLNFYLEHASELAPIFRSLYRLMDLINSAKIDPDEKRQYAKIVRAQLGEGELFLLRYNATTEYGKNFIYYITKYNLLKHLPPMSLMELKKFRMIMDVKGDNRSLAINILIQKLRRAIYKRTKYSSQYDDLSDVKIEKHSKYDVSVNMSDSKCTVLMINEIIDGQNTSSIFKAFLKFSPDDLKGFMDYVLQEIYGGSNFQTFNKQENSELKCDVTSVDTSNGVRAYKATVYNQIQGGAKKELRMSHPDLDTES